MKWCAYHKREEPPENFRLKKNGSLDSWCVEGRREYNRSWSRKNYAPKKAEVAQKKASPSTTKVCRGCETEKPVEDFPPRYDRPGKREARCAACIRKQRKEQRQRDYTKHRSRRLEWRKEYQRNNPGYNRESSRRRRARLQTIRHERYKDEEIRERDGGLCWFCKEFVDPDLRWPHPKSQVIHHLHPYSKQGPNIRKNVALAHADCNGKHRERYDSPFREGWRVEEIDSSVARETVIEHHYLHRRPNISYAFGLFEGPTLKGVVTLGSPSSFRITRSVASEDVKAVIELNRLWIDDDAPFGAGSWFVSRVLKMLPPYIVIAYADLDVEDPRYGTGHDGAVYRALSFYYAGESRPRTEYRVPGKTRNVGQKAPGAVKERVSPKKRYWTVTGTRRERKVLKALCEWPSLSYD